MKESQKRYELKTIRQYKFSLNKNTDTDMINWLETVPNFRSLVKRLLTEEMERSKNE